MLLDVFHTESWPLRTMQCTRRRLEYTRSIAWYPEAWYLRFSITATVCNKRTIYRSIRHDGHDCSYFVLVLYSYTQGVVNNARSVPPSGGDRSSIPLEEPLLSLKLVCLAWSKSGNNAGLVLHRFLSKSRGKRFCDNSTSRADLKSKAPNASYGGIYSNSRNELTARGILDHT